MPEVQPFTSDAPLFYNVGIFGDRGYGLPNFGKNAAGQTLNRDLEAFTTEGGLRTSLIMHQPNANRIDPPDVNIVVAMIIFINRARTLLIGRSIAENEPRFTGEKVRSVRIPLRVFPCPFHQVRNRLMRDFCESAFACLAELFQSTENTLDRDVSAKLAEVALRYVRRFQRDMAMDYFGMSKEAASALDLDLSKHVQEYGPLANGFVSAESFDRVTTLSFPDPVDLGPLGDGILIQNLPALGPYPYADTGTGGLTAENVSTSRTGVTGAVPAFPDSTYNL